MPVLEASCKGAISGLVRVINWYKSFEPFISLISPKYILNMSFCIVSSYIDYHELRN